MTPNDRRRHARIYRHPGAAAILGRQGDWLLQAREGWRPPAQQGETLLELEAAAQRLHPCTIKTPNLLGLVVQLVVTGDPEDPDWTVASVRSYRFQIDSQWKSMIRLRPRLPWRHQNLWMRCDDERIQVWRPAEDAPAPDPEDLLRDLRPQDGPA